jgi:hypothetical protein
MDDPGIPIAYEPIVIDKSYLFSESADKIKKIAEKSKILICESLLSETAKDDPTKRARLYKKIPSQPKYCEYIPSVSRLLRFEQEKKAPCGKPSSHIVARDYSLTGILKNPETPFPANLAPALDKELEFQKSMLNATLQELAHIFNQCTRASAAKELDELLNGKIRSSEVVNGIIEKAKNNGALVPVAPPLTKEWLTFRYFQVKHIHALDCRARYSDFDLLRSESAKIKISHDIHDMNYLILALLEGRFATSEKKLKKWWTSINGRDGLVE